MSTRTLIHLRGLWTTCKSSCHCVLKWWSNQPEVLSIQKPWKRTLTKRWKKHKGRVLKRNSQFQHQTHGYFAVALVPRGTWSSRPTFCCWIICKLFLGVGRKGPQAICSKQWICRICCVIFMSQDAWCTSYNPPSTLGKSWTSGLSPVVDQSRDLWPRRDPQQPERKCFKFRQFFAQYYFLSSSNGWHNCKR